MREGNRQVQRIRWTPAAGDLSHVFDDDLVCASIGVDAGRLRSIEPFPTGSLVPYDPGYLAGWTVERYQIDLVAAAQRSRAQMDAELRAMCAQQIPGETYRNLVVDARYTDQTFKHILAPVWLLTYGYKAATYQVVVNGVTGRLSGSRPWSWIKVTLLVLAIFIVVLTVYALNQ